MYWVSKQHGSRGREGLELEKAHLKAFFQKYQFTLHSILDWIHQIIFSEFLQKKLESGQAWMTYIIPIGTKDSHL